MKEWRKGEAESESRQEKIEKYGRIPMHIIGLWALSVMSRVFTKGEKLDLRINLVVAEIWIKTI